eukprot:gene1177-1289_t
MDSTSQPRSLQVIFIRHAETQENVKVSAAAEVLLDLSRFSLPSWHHLSQSLSLLFLHENSSLTPRGQEQLERMSQAMRESGFWSKHDFQLCLYSPYERTKATALALLPPDKLSLSRESSLLKEISPLQHLYSSQLAGRIRELEDYLVELSASDDSLREIVLVGHCKYFQELLNMDSFMWNCDVWKANFIISANTGRGMWTDLNLLLRSPLASPHPADSLTLWRYVNKLRRKGSKSRRGGGGLHVPAGGGRGTAGRREEDDGEEPICRICQAYQSEMPEKVLIRPCLCSGSQAFVHVDCLNQWRATSSEAFTKCSICQYQYQIKRSKMLTLLTNPILHVILAIVTSLTVSYAVGCVAEMVLSEKHLTWLDSLFSDLTESCGPLTQKGVNVHLDHLYGKVGGYLARVVIWLLCGTWGPFWKRWWVGLVITGVFGQFLQFFFPLFMLGIQNQNRGQFAGMFGMTFVWFNSMNFANTVKIWTIIGQWWLINNLYLYTLAQTQQVAMTWFGDEILERT